MDVCLLALLGNCSFLHCSNSLLFLSMLQYCHMAGEWLFLMFRIACNDMFSFLHGRWLYYSVSRTEGPSKEECHCGIIYWMVGYCGWAKGYQGTFQMFCLTQDQILLPLLLTQSLTYAVPLVSHMGFSSLLPSPYCNRGVLHLVWKVPVPLVLINHVECCWTVLCVWQTKKHLN